MHVGLDTESFLNSLMALLPDALFAYSSKLNAEGKFGHNRERSMGPSGRRNDSRPSRPQIQTSSAPAAKYGAAFA